MAHIKTFLRVKTCKEPYQDFETTNDRLYIRVPENLRDFQKRESVPTINHEYRFGYIFNDKTSQQEVFDKSARDIINGFLKGYNGTIFAYGQTGSGKTFTVEGGARKYEDRGLSPRAISAIYTSLASRRDEDINIHISYMEIYQEIGYDLLNPGARTGSLVTPFPKVAVVDGVKGSCTVRNLSSHLAATEEVAQHLLLQGQANRKVSETAMNHRSSRSHAVFTIRLTARGKASDTVIKSKLHLVDLAGSERVSRSGIQGQQLSEAKFINLSLHHLEGVIIALQRSAQANRAAAKTQGTNVRMYNRWVSSLQRPASADSYRSNTSKYIPYRNSLLTMVLRDSLGGNCQTAMIATVVLDDYNLGESLSTCRFSQRVAMITNVISKNEEMDDRCMIRRLRKRIAELETEMAFLRSGESQGSDTNESRPLTNTLTDEIRDTCTKTVHGYLAGRIKDPITSGITSPVCFRECFRIMKSIVLDNKSGQHDNQPIDLLKLESSSTKSDTSFSDDASLRSKMVKGNMQLQRFSSTSSIMKSKASDDDGRISKKEDKSRREGSRTGHRDRSASRSKEAAQSGHRDRSASRSKEAAQSGHRERSASRSKDAHSGHRERSASRSKEAAQSTHIKDDKSFTSTSSHKDYKSPFERKRDAEIKKLKGRVEKVKENQKEQSQKLKKFQTAIRTEELNIVRADLENKLAKTSSALLGQKAFLARLKDNHAAPDLIEQEKVAEKQLQKKKAKMSKRIQLIDEKIAEIESLKGASGEHLGKSKLDHLAKQYAKKDGKVNSRLVLDLLQDQEREQRKNQSKLDEAKVLTLSKQIEVKEAATRQKLLEFKERMKGKPPEKATNAFCESLYTSDSGRDMSEDDSYIPSVSDAENVEIAMRQRRKLSFDSTTRPDTGESQLKVPQFIMDATKSNTSLSLDVQNKNLHKKDPENRWNNAYGDSRERSWTDTVSFMDHNVGGAFTTTNMVPPPGLGIKSHSVAGFASGYDDLLDIPALANMFDEASNALDGDMGFARGYDDFSDLHMTDFGDLPTSPSDNLGPKSSSYDNIPSSADNTSYDYDDGFTNGSDWLKERLLSKNDLHQSSLSVEDEAILAELASMKDGAISDQDGDKILPSEYANQINKKDFDARKMGFGNKTFDTALNKMLANENPLVVSNEAYDKFARTTSPWMKSTSSKSKCNVSMRRAQSKRNQREGSSQVSAESTWGPEAKNVSISDRLERYLDMDSVDSSSNQYGKSFDDTANLKKPRVVDDEQPREWNSVSYPTKTKPKVPSLNFDMDEFSPKIKALNDGDRENYYMKSAREQKERISKIRKARTSAQVIQRAWRQYHIKK